MKNKPLFLYTILLLGFSSILWGQGEYEETDWERWKKDRRPFLDATYGVGFPEQIRFQGEFSDIGLVEAKIGYSKVKQYKKYVYSLDESFLYGSYLATDLYFSDQDTLGKVNMETIRFGLANRLGYGYHIGAFDILPYNERSLVWTKVSTTTRPDNLIQTDIDILNRYEDAFRFGELTEGGVKFKMFNFLALNGAYELQVVYPRHLFWKWLGSIMIRDAGIAAITVFSEDILDRTAFLGPIIYFALKNGLTYAFYNAMRYNMNWPFTTEEPLTFVNFKVSASITF